MCVCVRAGVYVCVCVEGVGHSCVCELVRVCVRSCVCVTTSFCKGTLKVALNWFETYKNYLFRLCQPT